VLHGKLEKEKASLTKNSGGNSEYEELNGKISAVMLK